MQLQIAKYLILLFSGVQTQAANHNSLEIRQAQTFFGVVALFFIGHTLRIFLNLHEITLLHGDVENTGGCKLRLWNQVNRRIFIQESRSCYFCSILQNHPSFVKFTGSSQLIQGIVCNFAFREHHHLLLVKCILSNGSLQQASL